MKQSACNKLWITVMLLAFAPLAVSAPATSAAPPRHACPSTYAERPSSRNRSVEARAWGVVSGSTQTRFEVAPPRSSLATVRFNPSRPCASTRGSSSSNVSGVRATKMMRPLRSRARIAGRSTPRTYSRSVTARSSVRSSTSAPKRPSYPGGTGRPASPSVRASGVSITGLIVNSPSSWSVRRVRVELFSSAREIAPPGLFLPRRNSTLGGTPSFVATDFPIDDDATAFANGVVARASSGSNRFLGISRPPGSRRRLGPRRRRWTRCRARAGHPPFHADAAAWRGPARCVPRSPQRDDRPRATIR